MDDSLVMEKELLMNSLQTKIHKIKASQELILTRDLNGRVGRRED